jgi:hypothetical protein
MRRRFRGGRRTSAAKPVEGPRSRLDCRAVGGFWTIFFLLVVLKIPVLGSLWLVWWASRAKPLPEDAPDDGGGHRFRNPDPPRPRGPRRGGPHGTGATPLADCPPGGRQRPVRAPLPLRTGVAHARGTPSSPEHSER